MHVEFNDERNNAYSHQNESGLYGYLMSSGLANNRDRANAILIGILLFCVAGTLLIATSDSQKNATPINPADSQEAGNPLEIR